MNKLAVQRQSRPLLPELSELFNGLPSLPGLRPFFENHLLRLEDETKDGIYEVRAELPGVDPVSDVEVTVRDGRLTIKARADPHLRGERDLGVLLRFAALALWHCPTAPTRTTSPPPTTGAS